MADETRVQQMPEQGFGEPDEQFRRLAHLVNGLVGGSGNNHYLVTLNKGITITLIPIPGIRPGAVVTMTAQNELAASETGLWVEVAQDEVVIHHQALDGERIFGAVTNG